MQLVVPQCKVIEVTSHILGGYQRGIYIDVITVGIGRKHLLYHGHLDIVGHGEFPFNAGFVFHPLTYLGKDEATCDDKKQEACQTEVEQLPRHLIALLEDI